MGKVIKKDPACGWCVYNESDGHCTCKRQCEDCGTKYVGMGEHSTEDCIATLKKQVASKG